jgi:hypothetical protein
MGTINLQVLKQSVFKFLDKYRLFRKTGTASVVDIRCHTRELGIDVRVLLTRILDKWGVILWTEIIWIIIVG